MGFSGEILLYEIHADIDRLCQSPQKHRLDSMQRGICAQLPHGIGAGCSLRILTVYITPYKLMS